MNPLLLHPTNWKDYSLLDSGDGKKLERFGNFLFIRPEPQALWSPRFPLKNGKNPLEYFFHHQIN